jgi:hypothetical protein
MPKSVSRNQSASKRRETKRREETKKEQVAGKMQTDESIHHPTKRSDALKRERVEMYHAIKDKEAKKMRKQMTDEIKQENQTYERKQMQEDILHRNFQQDRAQWLQPFFVDKLLPTDEWAVLPMSALRHDAWEIAVAYYDPTSRLYGIWGYVLVYKLMQNNRFDPPFIRVHQKDAYRNMVLPSGVSVSMDFASSMPNNEFAKINPFALSNDPTVQETLLKRVDLYTKMRVRHEAGLHGFQLVQDEDVSWLSVENREMSRYLSLTYFLWSLVLIRAEDPYSVVMPLRSFHRTATCVADHASTDELLVSDRDCSQVANMILIFEKAIHEKRLALSLYDAPSAWIRFLHLHAAKYGISVLREFSSDLPLEAKRFNGSHSQWYKVPWTLAEPLVSKRVVYMDKGFAFVPSNLVLWVIRRVFAFPDFGSLPFLFTVDRLKEPRRLEQFHQLHRVFFSPFAKALVWALPKTGPRLTSALQRSSEEWIREEEDFEDCI